MESNFSCVHRNVRGLGTKTGKERWMEATELKRVGHDRGEADESCCHRSAEGTAKLPSMHDENIIWSWD